MNGRILDKTPHLAFPEEELPGPERESKGPGDPTTIANLGDAARRQPVNTAKSRHLNLVSSQVEQGPEPPPPTVISGGFSLPGGKLGRPGDARSGQNRDQLNRANAASGRATLIGGS